MENMSGYNLGVSKAVELIYQNNDLRCHCCHRRRPILPTGFVKRDPLKDDLAISSWAYNDPGWIEVATSQPPYGKISNLLCPECAAPVMAAFGKLRIKEDVS